MVPEDSVIILESSTSKRCSPALNWSWTYNNYPSDFEAILVPRFQKAGVSYIFQEERGDVGDTPHLQGYMKFPEKSRPLSIFNREVMPVHWEVARSVKHLISYCSDPEKIIKGGKVYANIPYPKPLKLITPSYDWQLEILEIIKGVPDDRVIHWYWSKEGGVGKTQFCKFLHARHCAAVLNGKGHDVRNGVLSYYNRHGMCPELCVMNIPRCYGDKYVSYEAFENIKDMFFYSGKYEGGDINGNSPHLFIFANTPPILDKMSGDRWLVKEIE